MKIIWPAKSDARWFQVAFLLLFDLYAVSTPGFSRTAAQFAAGMSTCVLLDAGLAYFVDGLLLFPLSGLISSMGLLLLCDSHTVWVYPVIGATAILSKHFLRLNGRHIFNPLNFAVVMGLVFLPGAMTTNAGRWGGSLWGMAAVAAFGVLTVYRAKRLELSAAYVAVFLAGAGIRSFLTGAPFLVVARPITGAAFQLFTFFMITDPATTPQSRTGRISFGAGLAAMDAVLRHRQFYNGPFFALFVLSGVLSYFYPPARRAQES